MRPRRAHHFMKRLLLLFAALLVAVTAAPRAGAAISVSVFYDSLEPYGEWIDSADYGYVWHPADVDADWRPYTAGHWVFTDVGWTWVSDEPFGWATYHYGRWVNLVNTGWSWVPDTEWGPAWVSWRRSPRHVGWAPLPPEARFREATTISSWVDGYYDIGPGYYNFVEVRQFGAPRLREVVLPARENVTIVNETRNITNITYVNNVVHNGGPEYDVITKESAQPIRRLKLERQTDFQGGGATRADALRPRVEGDVLRVMAPSIEAAPNAAPKRVARKIETAEVNRGWKDVGEKGQADQLRARLKAEAKPPAGLPAKPKFERVMARQDGAEKPAATEAGTAPVPAAPTAAAPTAPGAGAGEKPAATTDKSPRTAGPAAQKGGKGGGKNSAAVGAEPASKTAPEGTVAPESNRLGKTAKKGPKGGPLTGAPEEATARAAEPSSSSPGENADRKGRKRNGPPPTGPASPAGESPATTGPEDRPPKNRKGESRGTTKPEPSEAAEPASPGSAAERPARNGRAADVEKAGRREAKRDGVGELPGRSGAEAGKVREVAPGRGSAAPATTDEEKARERKKGKKNEPEGQ
jgi:hypothetical protein